MTVLVPPAPRIALVDQNGNITRPWFLYFQELFNRVGGSVSTSNSDLQDQVIVTNADIAELGELVGANTIRVFGRETPQAPANPANANDVLCSRIFAAR